MSRISGVAAGAGVAAALVVAFVLCTIAAVILPNVQASHMWISLFTSYPAGSAGAWMGGIVSSAAGGFVSGWIFAYVYNRVSKA
ncbi:MAG: hypothetical protein AAB605_00100 [Patescibacteria group bacterium]